MYYNTAVRMKQLNLTFHHPCKNKHQNNVIVQFPGRPRPTVRHSSHKQKCPLTKLLHSPLSATSQ